LDQWLELKTLFNIVRFKEHCYTAGVLYNILYEVQLVKKSFESNSADSIRDEKRRYCSKTIKSKKQKLKNFIKLLFI